MGREGGGTLAARSTITDFIRTISLVRLATWSVREARTAAVVGSNWVRGVEEEREEGREEGGGGGGRE